MTAQLCVCGCGRPLIDGYATAECARKAAQRLADIAELVPAARSVAYGLARRGEGGGSGKPGSRSPGNDDAMDALDGVQNTLTTLARDIAEARGAQIAVDGSTHPDPLIHACSWLSGQLEWVRHSTDAQGGPYATAVFAEIAECLHRMRSIVDGPRPKKYLGPCGAETEQDVSVWDGERNWEMFEPGPPCDGDVYGVPGNSTGTCRTCGAKVDQAERAAWLDSEVRQRAFTRSDIEDAYGIKANTVTTWWIRGKIAAYWVTETGLHVEWVQPELDPAMKGADREARERDIKAEVKARGSKVFYLDDVLKLAAGDAARREEARARRAARQEAEMGA